MGPTSYICVEYRKGIGGPHSRASCTALVSSHSNVETMTSGMITALIVFFGALVFTRSQQSDVEVAQCATSSLEGFDFQVGVGNNH